VGYAAAEQGDYHTALINFRRALAARPGDRYALAGIRNMESYIAIQRADAARRSEIARLETTVAAAVAASDWACAAASVDRLVELVPPTSPDRDRLIAYRGELAGMIASRDNLDSWSTVCPGGQI
jgi:tetratricopeptide (TPR) repeat protein